jgi:hypothetical protein
MDCGPWSGTSALSQFREDGRDELSGEGEHLMIASLRKKEVPSWPSPAGSQKEPLSCCPSLPPLLGWLHESEETCVKEETCFLSPFSPPVGFE